MDKRTAALALNLSAVLIAFAGLILMVFLTSSGSPFSSEMNLLGFALAMAVIAAGVIYYYQVSKI